MTETETSKKGLLAWLPAGLLASLKPSNRRKTITVWVLLILAPLVVFAPLASMLWTGRDEASAKFGALNGDARDAVLTLTRTETRKLQTLTLMSDPLAPSPPPAQGIRPPSIEELSGVRPDERDIFMQVTQRIRASTAECHTWVGNDEGGVQSVAMADAQALLASIAGQAGTDRGVFRYHQGLITLCGPDGAGALADFRGALERYEAFRDGPGASDEDKRRSAQFETVVRYGIALALLADDDASPADVDRELTAALQAAERIQASRKAGPFVEMTACEEPRGCSAFDFSTAEIFNAKLYNWLRAGNPNAAYRSVGAALEPWSSQLAAHPTLAANFAAASAASGHGDEAKAVFQSTRARLQTPDVTIETPAWARIVAMGVVGPPPTHDGGEPWPIGGEATIIRDKFTATPPFPAIALADANDRDTIDLWLWVQRGRMQLLNDQLEGFLDDVPAIRNLPPAAQEFVFSWRSETTSRLGDELLARAQTVRKRNGAAAAAPMLTVLGGDGFPFHIRAQAILTKVYGVQAAPLALAIVIVMAFIVLMAAAHLMLAAGHGLTFPRRHYEERTGGDRASRASP